MVTRYKTFRPVALAIIASFLLLLPVSAGAADESGKLPLTYTLDDCLRIAGRQSPAILAAAEEMKRTKGLIWEVWASIVSVDATASYTYYETPPGSRIPADSFGAGVPPSDVFVGIPSHDRYNVGVTGTLPLFTGGRVVSGLAVAYLSDDIAFEAYRKAVNDTLYNVRVAFYSIVLAREVVKVRTDALDLLTRQLELTRKKYDVGVVSKYDLLRSEVEVANARPPLIEAKKNLVLAGETLKRVLGIDVEDPFEVEGELTFNEESADIDGLLKEADEGSPELIIARKTERIAAKNVNMTIGEFLPTISAFAQYGGTIYNFSWNEDDWLWDFTGGVTVSVPLTGLAVSAARVKEARADYMKARIGMLDTVNKVKLDIKSAYYDLVQAREIVESQRLNIAQAEEALKIAEVRYDSGISTLLELMDAQLALTTARLNWLNALYGYEEAKARISKIVGAEGPKKK
jgi:outer membrane protein